MRRIIEPSAKLWFVISVLILLAVIIYRVVLHNTVSIEEAGLIGDSFGALNTLFTGLAFSGVIVTIGKIVQIFMVK